MTCSTTVPPALPDRGSGRPASCSPSSSSCWRPRRSLGSDPGSAPGTTPASPPPSTPSCCSARPSVALLLVAWATKTDRITKLLDGVVDQVLEQVS